MLHPTLRLALLAASSVAVAACQSTDAGVPASDVDASAPAVAKATPAALTVPTGGLVTLYAFDPEMHSISFVSGGGRGSILQENEAFNYNAQLDYNEYWPEHFSAGISGGQKGSILDLGPTERLGEQFDVSETVGNDQAFASIRLEAGSLLISGIRDDDETQTLGSLEGLLPANSYSEHVEAKLGHVYLMRIDDGSEGESCVVKFVVVDLDPGVHATIRWERLDV